MKGSEPLINIENKIVLSGVKGHLVELRLPETVSAEQGKVKETQLYSDCLKKAHHAMWRMSNTLLQQGSLVPRGASAYSEDLNLLDFAPDDPPFQLW
jgi:hypothetical protein